jgi:two-component system chemotaxis sensor kinase CheA
MHIDTQQFHEAFFDEAAEHLAVMEENLLLLEENPQAEDVLNNIFRSAHSIKGSGGTFGFNEIAAFTHGLENLLDQMRAKSITATQSLVGLLLQSTDHLGALVAAAKNGESYPSDIDQLTQKITQACSQKQDASAASETPSPTVALPGQRCFEIAFKPERGLFRQGGDPLLLLQDLRNLADTCEITLHESSLPPLAEFDPEDCYLSWTIRLRTQASLEQIRDVFVFVEDSSELTITEQRTEQENCKPLPARPEAVLPTEEASAPRGPATIETSSIRVAIDKVDELINLVGELVIAQSMANQALARAAAANIQGAEEAKTLLERSTRDIQERIMSVRMVPLTSIFRRVPRIVRDLANTMGKQVRVELLGEDTEIDKQMIESISDPLIHLVRNSVDHGIETIQQRVAAGKSPEGTIRLRASHEGGNVVIEISDDGAGLNAEKIRRKAVALGIIDETDNLTSEQAHNLILMPGFSTAETISDISGRGVGMDVVKRNIESLNGAISIESTPGSGTKMTIRLPLTLAIVEGLSVALSEEIYILPLLSVVESICPTKEQVKSITHDLEVVMVRGETVPLVRLHQMLNRPAKNVDPTTGTVVILECGNRRVALLVDKLLGQTHAVMKSLEANYAKVRGLAGATILGDGQVAFVLDVSDLGRNVRGN